VPTYSPYPAITLFSFDIDKLKYTNDTYGHAAGDELIRSTAMILKKCLREDDIVIRMGGDEFLAILQDCDAEMAGMIEQRIRIAIDAYNASISEIDRRISISFGFAVAKSDELTIEQLIQKADMLMYQNKAINRAHE